MQNSLVPTIMRRGAGAEMEIDVHIPARAAGILAQQAGRVGLIDGDLEVRRLVVELAADIDVAGVRAHREAGDQAALDQLMRIVPHDDTILARTGFALVGYDHEIMRL